MRKTAILSHCSNDDSGNVNLLPLMGVKENEPKMITFNADKRNFLANFHLKPDLSGMKKKHVAGARNIKLLCVDCSSALPGVKELLQHRRDEHPMKPPFQCAVCGRCCRTEDSLSRHVSVHLKMKPYSCGECGVRFSHTAFLLRHLRFHQRKVAITKK